MRENSPRCDGRNSKRKEFFKKRIPVYRKNPVLYAREVLLFEPDEWQQAALMDLAAIVLRPKTVFLSVRD